MAVLDQTIDVALRYHAGKVASLFEADVFSFVGIITQECLEPFRSHMEHLDELGENDKPARLVFFLHTPGGVVEVAEKMVEITRHHYQKVWFVVPDMAMSTGTILCMSGDQIHMDYSSSLGPIDPQVINSEGQLVPALGYLDQVDDMIEKSRAGTLTDAEFAILQSQDLATLRRYEQARDLSISLSKAWLVKYKFKDWTVHSSSGEHDKEEREVTDSEKEERAQKIAEALSDHTKWHSHRRMIGINTLTNELRLKIEDYSKNRELKNAIREYSDLLLDCIRSRATSYMIHTQALAKATYETGGSHREGGKELTETSDSGEGS